MENYSPNLVRQLSKELQELVMTPPEGIQVILNESDLTDLQALITGPAETPYAHGSFHVRLTFGGGYPAQPPRGFFLTKIFHPNINEKSGEICVNTLKRDWTPQTGVKHLLLVIKCLLIVPNPESALNEEAGRLLLEDYEEYARRARLFTEIHARRVNQPVTNCASTIPVPTTEPAAAAEPLKEQSQDSSSTGGQPPGKKHAGEKNSVTMSSATSSGSGTTAAQRRTKKTLKRL